MKNDILERDKIDASWTHPAKGAIRIENGSKPLSDMVRNLFAIFNKLTEIEQLYLFPNFIFCGIKLFRFRKLYVPEGQNVINP